MSAHSTTRAGTGKGAGRPTATPAPGPAPSSGRSWWKVATPLLIVAGAGGGFLIGRTTADRIGSSAASETSGYTAADQQAIDAVLQEGLTFHVAGQLDQAQEKYEQVLAADPGNKFALFNLGLIAQTRGDYETAVTRYEASLLTDATYAPARYNLGIVYAAQQRWVKAEDAFRAVLAAEPDNAAVTYQLGLVLVGKGDVAGGQQLIDTAVSLDPTVTAPTSTDPG